MSFIPGAPPNVPKYHARCSELGLVGLPGVCFGVFGFPRRRVHPPELRSDLQRCSILDLRDVELEKEPTADAEEEKYEEAEAVQMFLRRKEDGQSRVNERTGPNREPAHLYDGKDHPQDKQTRPADGAPDGEGG